MLEGNCAGGDAMRWGWTLGLLLAGSVGEVALVASLGAGGGEAEARVVNEVVIFEGFVGGDGGEFANEVLNDAAR
ncbi:hypothetical protein HC928_03140 [bacterium]|nr:hypothetical protein [bacterium]